MVTTYNLWFRDTEQITRMMMMKIGYHPQEANTVMWLIDELQESHLSSLPNWLKAAPMVE